MVVEAEGDGFDSQNLVASVWSLHVLSCVWLGSLLVPQLLAPHQRCEYQANLQLGRSGVSHVTLTGDMAGA